MCASNKAPGELLENNLSCVTDRQTKEPASHWSAWLDPASHRSPHSDGGKRWRNGETEPEGGARRRDGQAAESGKTETQTSSV